MAKYPCTKCKLSDGGCAYQHCEKWRSWFGGSWLKMQVTWLKPSKCKGQRTACITAKKKGGAASDI